MISLTPTEKAQVRILLRAYEENKPTLNRFLNNLQAQVVSYESLAPHIHSVRYRLKDACHLEHKLKRKIKEARLAGRPFSITPSNLMMKINDLAGLRIIHLHTEQFRMINAALHELFAEEAYDVHEKPSARTWDDESRQLFRSMGIRTKASPSLYTSVHYVIKPNRKTKYTCEIQVRTLMEEVWGEVDHEINYPDKSKHLACKEQIAALARSTSSCSRLVDSIFRSDSALKLQDAKDALVRKRLRKARLVD